MSLLLQALQKAARNREDSEAGPQKSTASATLELDSEPDRGDTTSDPLALAEEQIFEPEPLAEIDHAPSSATLQAGSGPIGVSDSQAATMLRPSELTEQTWVDKVRERPVHAFVIVAGCFALLYGAYVYLQIAHPALLRGEFVSHALQTRTPSPSPVAMMSRPATSISPAAAPPAVTAAIPDASVRPAPPHIGETNTANAITSDVGIEDRPTKSPKRKQSSQDALQHGPFEAQDQPPVSASARAADAPVDASKQVYVRAPDAHPVLLAPGLMDAWKALQEGRLEQAEALYQSVLRNEPNSVDALLGLAVIAAHTGRIEPAIRHYERALELEPRNPSAQAGLIAIIGQADPQLSESRLKQLIARDPASYLYFCLGNLYAQQGKWPEAQQAYFQAYQLQPDNPDSAYNLAIGLEHLDQPKIALTYYSKALELRGLKGNANFDQDRVQKRIADLARRVGE